MAGALLSESMFAGHAAAAGSAVAVAAALTHPLDTLKTLLQVSAGSGQKLSFFQVVDRVRSVSGLSGLYNGIGWSMLGMMSGMGARFGVFEILTAFYKDGREDEYVYVAEALLAGIVGGATEAVVSTPFELLKLRGQVSSTAKSRSMGATKSLSELVPVAWKLLPTYNPDQKMWNQTLSLLTTLPKKHSNMAVALKQYPWLLTGSGRPPLASEVKRPSDIISLEGWQALWRGLRPGIVRDCVFGGIFFSTWQFIHIGMLNWKALDIDPPPRSINGVGPVSPLAASLAAGISGSIAAAASHTLDTAKCRSQCIVIPKYISMERKLLRWKAPGNWIERVAGTSPADRNILFRGIWLRMARSGLASFAVVGSYLFAVDHFV
ncbi:Mitochondrial carnitine-acylcarnitine carrier protein [Dioscorea alata]|uniref:Mitochondrial carnitine-acylcarnitine carrier protein n=1 Tax=Dioscorea alata TaxID=55571 RepID=A0ACB7UR60_DIOAL|nr:Mitochondrial carnitine-acylcarnitine carrier protein [Dioscorea alata]